MERRYKRKQCAIAVFAYVACRKSDFIYYKFWIYLFNCTYKSYSFGFCSSKSRSMNRLSSLIDRLESDYLCRQQIVSAISNVSMQRKSKPTPQQYQIRGFKGQREIRLVRNELTSESIVDVTTTHVRLK